jgi:hypothetical protein
MKPLVKLLLAALDQRVLVPRMPSHSSTAESLKFLISRTASYSLPEAASTLKIRLEIVEEELT